MYYKNTHSPIKDDKVVEIQRKLNEARRMAYKIIDDERALPKQISNKYQIPAMMQDILLCRNLPHRDFVSPGWPELKINGMYLDDTERAVRWFQCFLMMTETGILDDTTYRYLLEFLLSNSSNAPSILYRPIIDQGEISESDYKRCADTLGVEVAAVKAVKTVESGGAGIKDGIPTMLFEGHIFWGALKQHGMDPNKYVDGNENILYRNWTRTYYTGKNYGEYLRLQKAIKIHEAAAYESASYGLFQILGINYGYCGFSSAKDFYYGMCKGERAQLDAFVKYIKGRNLDIYLKNRDWAGFAKRYNGPGYAKNHYDVKLEKAYLKFK